MRQDVRDWIWIGCLSVIVALRFAKWYCDYKWFSYLKKRMDKMEKNK